MLSTLNVHLTYIFLTYAFEKFVKVYRFSGKKYFIIMRHDYTWIH